MDSAMNTIELDVSVDTDLMSPGQLESFLRKLKELLCTGALTHVRTQGTLVTSIDFDQLNESGPWPDIIDEEFVDAQGRRFHLFVDSYHGAGGKWARSDTE
jgi:hypothetical protein